MAVTNYSLDGCNVDVIYLISDIFHYKICILWLLFCIVFLYALEFTFKIERDISCSLVFFFVVVVFAGEKTTWIDEQRWRTGNFNPNIVVGFCPCTVLFILAHQ